MKYIVILLIALTSCSIPVMESDIPEIDFTGCSTEKEKVDRIYKSYYKIFNYKRDINQFYIPEYWQPAYQVLKTNTGDCEDFCIAFIYLCNYYLDIKLDIVEARDGEKQHTTVYYSGKYYYSNENYKPINKTHTYKDLQFRGLL
jgi:hypothetical protein